MRLPQCAIVVRVCHVDFFRHATDLGADGGGVGRYEAVGTSVVLTMLLNMLYPHVVPVRSRGARKLQSCAEPRFPVQPLQAMWYRWKRTYLAAWEVCMFPQRSLPQGKGALTLAGAAAVAGGHEQPLQRAGL